MGDTSETTRNPAQFVELTSQLKNYVDTREVGAIIGLIYKDGEVVYQNKFGFQNVKEQVPIEYNSIFRFYSMTKPIVSVAALQLWEQGKYQLSDPVSKFIPKFKGLKVFKQKTDDAIEVEDLNREVTIFDIFTHTSGFSYGSDPNDLVDQMYVSVYKDITKNSLAQMIDGFLDIPLRYQPGTRWNYSISTDILGYLVEIISGKTLDEYLKEHIFDPLQMTDTGFFVPKEKLSRFVTLYKRSNDLLVEHHSAETDRYLLPVTYLSGGGGLVSTLYDYLNFCKMLLGDGELYGRQILQSETVKKMCSNNLPDEIPELDYLGDTASFRGERFGLGVAVICSENRRNHSIGSYYWLGAALTNFHIDPSTNSIFIILSQYMPSIDKTHIIEAFYKFGYDGNK